MSVKRYLLAAFSAAILILPAISGCAYAANAQEEQSVARETLNNLQAAYNSEVNDAAMYLAFAEQAKREEYGSIASLFNAIAYAEQLHAGRFAALIEARGGTPKASMETTVAGDTKANLDISLAAEREDHDVMYAAFLQQAEEEGDREAAAAFRDIQAAEASHTAGYVKVLENIEELKGLQKDFFVCPTCGYVLDVLSVPQCPVCGTDRMQFKKR